MKPVLYDVLRLFIGPWFQTPRGIDRVDLAFARHLFFNPDVEVHGVMPTPWGVRMYDRQLVQRGLIRLGEIWNETTHLAGEDPALTRIRGLLTGIDPRWRIDTPKQSSWRRQARMLSATAVPLGRSVRLAPTGAIYLNVGQLGWAAPLAMGWLRQRRDVATVLMLHDAIAVQRADLATAFGNWAHRTMMRIAARGLDGLIATTKAAHDEVMDELRGQGGTVRRSIALPLPLAAEFLVPDPPDTELADARYFVICGTLETRKNHRMLLDLWQHVKEARLVVVGAPTGGSRDLLRKMQGMPDVVHAQGLSTPSLRVLLRHAQALLMPSLAEGFGLPVQEALSLGVPVIASDIAAHREVSQGQARLLPADDAAAWLAAIQAEQWRPNGYRPMLASDYFERVDAFLDDL